MRNLSAGGFCASPFLFVLVEMTHEFGITARMWWIDTLSCVECQDFLYPWRLHECIAGVVWLSAFGRFPGKACFTESIWLWPAGKTADATCWTGRREMTQNVLFCAEEAMGTWGTLWLASRRTRVSNDGIPNPTEWEKMLPISTSCAKLDSSDSVQSVA